MVREPQYLVLSPCARWSAGEPGWWELWDMRLHYDYYSGRYVGERYSVDEWTFLQVLQTLIMAGYEPEAALDRALDEAMWSETTAGVALLPEHPVCHYCGQGLPPPRQAFCDTRCEAALVVQLLQQTR